MNEWMNEFWGKSSLFQCKSYTEEEKVTSNRALQLSKYIQVSVFITTFSKVLGVHQVIGGRFTFFKRIFKYDIFSYHVTRNEGQSST